MKKLLFIIIMLLFTVPVIAMTPTQFQGVKTGDIVYLKLEWNGKVYLEGNAVVAYKIGDSAGLASTNPANNFSGGFNCGYLTMVKPSTDNSLLQDENLKLKVMVATLNAKLNGLLAKLNQLIADYEGM